MADRLLTLPALASALALLLATGAPAAARGDGTVAGAPRPSASAPPPSLAPQTAALEAERSRLRRELERTNTEIDALKRAGGLRDDYRLRARLADAEALARRLTEIEARLGIKAGPSAAPFKPATVPVASPTDGPAELEAKADILADQSRRFRLQAEALGRRAQEVKGRQDLRRRVADLDRDPFGPMEGSKRRVASAVPGTPVAPETAGGNPGAVGGNTDRGNTPTFGTPPPGVTTTGGSQPTGLVSPPPMPAVSAPGGSTLSVQLRDLLDTTTLADIRRLERTGTAGSSVQALERAAAALRARAADFDARARTLRDEARGRLQK